MNLELQQYWEDRACCATDSLTDWLAAECMGTTAKLAPFMNYDKPKISLLGLPELLALIVDDIQTDAARILAADELRRRWLDNPQTRNWVAEQVANSVDAAEDR